MVAYSKLPSDHQQRMLSELQQTVWKVSDFQQARTSDSLISLPTGDGMALVFFGDPEAPVRCALELGRELRGHPEIKLRMGINSGPVYRMADINENRNVAGGGINAAQRVMDCGEAGHILISAEVATVLLQISTWQDKLVDLGEAEVKHGVRVHVFNLYTQDAGNPAVPEKLKRRRWWQGETRRQGLVAVGLISAVLLGFGSNLSELKSRFFRGSKAANSPAH